MSQVGNYKEQAENKTEHKLKTNWEPSGKKFNLDMDQSKIKWRRSLRKKDNARENPSSA